MSETFDAVADAMANAEAVLPANSAPQAEPIAETQAEDTAPPASADPNDDAPPEDAHETKSRAEQRIKQLAARDREAREEIAFLREQLARQQPQQPAPTQAAPSLPADLAQWVGDEPKPDAFPAGEFDPGYLRAVARFEARSEQAHAILAQRVNATRQQEDARARAFFEASAKAEKDLPDYREVVGTLGHSLAPWQANMLAEAGPEVAYTIGKDAEATARIRAARHPTAVALELGRTMERLAASKAASAAPPPQPSAAPAPPPKVVRGSSAPAGFDWATADVSSIQKRLNGG